jgi:hypothetical protein
MSHLRLVHSSEGIRTRAPVLIYADFASPNDLSVVRYFTTTRAFRSIDEIPTLRPLGTPKGVSRLAGVDLAGVTMSYQTAMQQHHIQMDYTTQDVPPYVRAEFSQGKEQLTFFDYGGFAGKGVRDQIVAVLTHYDTNFSLAEATNNPSQPF